MPPPLPNDSPLPPVAIPPPLPQRPELQSSSLQHSFAVLLSLFLGLFLADAFVCLADDTLIVFLGSYVLTGIRGLLAPLTLLLAIVIYMLMGLTPMIPKRLFLPLALFHPLAGLAAIPVLIYSPDRIQQVVWVISFFQVILGLGILYKIQGRIKFRWPIIEESQVPAWRFSWRNLCVFLLANVFVLLPVVAAYLAFCANRAIDHFSDGFLALRPEGLKVQVRKYVRNDGKTIQLVPMSHIGEPDFYRQLSKSFPTNAVILMEGVSDRSGLLTNRITYQRMAASLGVTEQHKEFRPAATQMVRADVDVDQFATNTIDFLNLATLVHTKGMNAETLRKVMQFSQPGFEEQLFEDVLQKRNRRVVDEIDAQLAQNENIIVPWGAAHMPGIAHEIQKSGFRLSETRDYVAIRFHTVGSKSTTDVQGKAGRNPK